MRYRKNLTMPFQFRNTWCMTHMPWNRQPFTQFQERGRAVIKRAGFSEREEQSHGGGAEGAAWALLWDQPAVRRGGGRAAAARDDGAVAEELPAVTAGNAAQPSHPHCSYKDLDGTPKDVVQAGDWKTESPELRGGHTGRHTPGSRGCPWCGRSVTVHSM